MNELSFKKNFGERKERKKQNKKKKTSFYFVNRLIINRKDLKIINNDVLLQRIEQRNYVKYIEYFFLFLLDGLNKNQVQKQVVVQ